MVGSRQVGVANTERDDVDALRALLRDLARDLGEEVSGKLLDAAGELHPVRLILRLPGSITTILSARSSSGRFGRSDSISELITSVGISFGIRRRTTP